MRKKIILFSAARPAAVGDTPYLPPQRPTARQIISTFPVAGSGKAQPGITAIGGWLEKIIRAIEINLGERDAVIGEESVGFLGLDFGFEFGGLSEGFWVIAFKFGPLGPGLEWAHDAHRTRGRRPIHGFDEFKTTLARGRNIVDERETEESWVFGELPAMIAGGFFGSETDPAPFMEDTEFGFTEAVDNAAFPFIRAMGLGAPGVCVIDRESSTAFALAPEIELSVLGFRDTIERERDGLASWEDNGVMIEPDSGPFTLGISDNAESGPWETALEDESDNSGGIDPATGTKDFHWDMFT